VSEGQKTAAVGELHRLAGDIEATSPGFAGRIRSLASALEDALPSAALAAFVEALSRMVRFEGAGRDAGLALVALPPAAIAALGPEGFAAWCDAVLRIGAHSTRGAQAFAVGSLASLTRAPAAIVHLAETASAVALLAERHPTDPLVQRFASAAGQAIETRSGAVVGAWAEYCEAALFGARRSGSPLEPLPEITELSDEVLAAAVDLAASAARVDRSKGRRVFAAAPGALAGVPPASRDSVTALARLLTQDAEALLDVLEFAGPVLRRLDRPARWMVVDLATEIAGRARSAVPRFLRSVLRVGEAVGFGRDLEAFVREGLALAEIHPVAAEAYFALETRGARAFLERHDAAVVLEDVESTLRGYVHLIEGARLPVLGVEARGLFTPLASDRESISVGKRMSVFPIWEENFTLVKLQATLAALWRREGAFDFSLARWLGREPDEKDGGIEDFFRRFASPEAASGLFVHFEALRVMPKLAESYPGLASDLREIRERIFPSDRVSAEAGPLAAILFLALGGALENVTFAGVGAEDVRALAHMARGGIATVYDSARCTTVFSDLLAEGSLSAVLDLDAFMAEDPMMQYLLDLEDAESAAAPGEPKDAPKRPDESYEGHGERSDETAPGIAADEDVLRAYLEQNPDLTVRRSEGPIDPNGLFVAGLTGGGLDGETPERSGASPDAVFALARMGRQSRGVHLHDEWDHRIGDYRVGWCQVHDVLLEGDSGEFFTSALARRRELLPEVRRQFQRVKPEGYRVLRGLLDGEDFDLNAVVDARADLRAHHNPDTKLYTERRREERDVATLFLLDMSASTDEEIEAKPSPAADDDAPPEVASLVARAPKEKRRRIIDIQKEALVIMSQALEELGDVYAIYGFSGHGRNQVELFTVKSFDEPLNVAVRGRIGGIEPQRSTRMGAALRQAVACFRNVASRSKHLILLSDGFPQDFDYGDDRRSNVYGLKDTAMALREAERGGISTYCITVDRAGNDYLREMCPEKRYLVIDEIDELPLELPKIYSETTRRG